MPLSLLQIVQNMETCSVEECNRESYSRGFCNLHYARFRRKGNTGLLRGKAPVGARGKFHKQREGAKNRNIPFMLTFDEWWKIWDGSGHWHERGCGKGQYVMARFNDVGPYSDGNVKIIRIEENTIEAHLGAKRSEITKERLSKAALGNKRWLGRVHSDEAKLKISETMKRRCQKVAQCL